MAYSFIAVTKNKKICNSLALFQEGRGQAPQPLFFVDVQTDLICQGLGEPVPLRAVSLRAGIRAVCKWLNRYIISLWQRLFQSYYNYLSCILQS